VISESQELSRTIATSLSHLAVHNSIPQVARINFWCRLSLFAARDRPWPCLEFHLNHVLVPDPTALFRTKYEEV